MVSISAIAQTASLMGDLARASMLIALMDGRALTATELARIASICVSNCQRPPWTVG